MADTELLPCPFCGGGDAFVERLDYTAAYVQCDADIGHGCACLARGPIAVQDDDGEEIPGGAGAIAAWNRRAALASRPAEVDGSPVDQACARVHLAEAELKAARKALVDAMTTVGRTNG